jgi:SAM-dependent methyltransferase
MIGFDPASFRDPAGRLFRAGDQVYRTCSPDALATLKAADEAGLLRTLEERGLFLPVSLVPAAAEGLSPAEVGGTVIRQPALSPVTYSYEWSFSMLRDAARATLDALDLCLDRGFILKDSTAFNVLFEGSAPRLVDVHSLERYEDGMLWAGYGQFCRAFLFPLFLVSYRGIDPRALLLAGLGEIGVDQVAAMLSWRDRLRPGVFVNVGMQNQLERQFAGRAEDVNKAQSGVRLPLTALRSQIRRVRSLVEALHPPKGDAWTTYVETHTYEDADVRRKEGFVAAALEAMKPQVALDLGTNTGQYARLARKSGARVVALDVSPACIDAVYRQASGDTGLSPVVADLSKPTPPAGWKLIERTGLLDRLRGDFLLALALIHHLRITGGIPLAEVVDLLTRLAPAGIIEWVGRGDSMVRRLLALRPDVYDDYTQQHFERLLSTRARIVAQESVSGGERTLYGYQST